MRSVEIRHHKHVDTLHWQIRCQWLGEDEWGTWLAAPVPTELRKGDADWWHFGAVAGAWLARILGD